MNIALNGLAVGLSLIVAIGPQNALLLKQGIRRSYVGACIAVCLISDLFLIIAGTAGVGVLVDKAPIALEILKWAGICYLLYFGYTCFRDAIKNVPVDPIDPDEVLAESELLDNNDGGQPITPASSSGTAVAVKEHAVRAKPALRRIPAPVLAAFAMTWLNPGTYVDIVVMLGGLANQYGEHDRWYFAAGALAASAIWFPTIGFGARLLAKPLSRPRVNQAVNIGIGIMMVFIAARLFMH